MAKQEEMNNFLSQIDNLLGSVKLDDVSAESNENRQELPDGYYLCEVEKAELTESKSTHMPMAAFTFKIAENGIAADMNEAGDITMKELEKTAGKKVWMYYVLKDEKSIRRFVSDMLKFEGEQRGEPLLGKEYFTNSEILAEALEVLVGARVYIQISTSENKDGSTNKWQNLISWTRVERLGLPVD